MFYRLTVCVFLVICRPSPIYSATQDKHISNCCLVLLTGGLLPSFTDLRKDRWLRNDELCSLCYPWNLWQYSDLFNLHGDRSCPLWLQHWKCTGLAYSEWFVEWVDARVGLVPEGHPLQLVCTQCLDSSSPLSCNFQFFEDSLLLSSAVGRVLLASLNSTTASA